MSQLKERRGCYCSKLVVQKNVERHLHCVRKCMTEHPGGGGGGGGGGLMKRHLLLSQVSGDTGSSRASLLIGLRNM